MKLHSFSGICVFAWAGFLLATGAYAALPHPVVNFRIIEQSVALRIEPNGGYQETVTRVLEPLTLSGVSTVGHLEITYPANLATVKILAAYTETVHHRRIPVLPSEIFHQSTATATEAPFLSDGHVLSLLYSGVTPGARVHLQYVETFKHPYLPGIYAVSEILAPEIPVGKAVISITAPRSIPLYDHIRGLWRKMRSRHGDMHTVTVRASWHQVSFPPLDAAAITQYAPMAVISTVAHWRRLARAYNRLAGPALRATPTIRQLARRVTRGVHGRKAVARLYRWMQTHIQSVSVDYAHAGFRPPRAASTLRRAMGDSNANVALLCALLQAVHVRAVPALLSVTARFVPYPGVDPFAFNHFLAYVPAYHLFIDTGARYAGLGVLPTGDQGRPVLITGDDPRFTRTPGPHPGEVETRVTEDLTLLPNGDMNGRSTITSAGWRAMQVRQDELAGRRSRHLARFMENNFYRSGNAGSLEVLAVRNRSVLNRPVTIVLGWHASGATIPGRKTALLLPSPGNIAATLVLFTSEATRRVPSVLQPVVIDERVRLHLPPGMVPGSLPRDQRLDTPFGNYRIRYRYDHGVLSVLKSLRLTRFLVSAREYPALHRLALIAVSSERKAVILRHDGP